MIPTARFLWLMTAGLIPLLLSAVYWPLAALAALWNLGLLAIALWDWYQTPRPHDAVTVERLHDERLSVAAENVVTVQVRNRLPRPLQVIVRDEPPVDFQIKDGDTRQGLRLLPPLGEASVTYTVTPPTRGNAQFGDVYLRILSPWKLILRQGQVPAQASVAVYPNLRAVEEYDLLVRRAQQARQGQRRARIIGGGREFASLRDYTPDDEYRTIDWKATARRGKAISRTYEAERSQDVLLLLDLGRLMRQEIAHTQKLDHVINSALMLAHVVGEADDRVGLLTFADEARQWLPPRRGRAQANEILDALYAARAEIVESDYRQAFRFLSTRWRKRSLAVLFTDLADPESSQVLLSEIASLARFHLVVCVVVRDPLMGERARREPTRANDVYEKAVAEEVLSDRQQALSLLARRGVLVVDAEPQDLSVDLVARYLDVKSRSLL